VEDLPHEQDLRAALYCRSLVYAYRVDPEVTMRTGQTQMAESAVEIAGDG
jgi:hypothetical protein